MHTETFAHRNFYTQKFLHRKKKKKQNYTQRSRYTEDFFTQRSLYTEEFLHAETFTQKKRLHRRNFTHRGVDTQRSFTQRTSEKLVHREPLHRETFTHRHVFTHRNFYTEKSWHTGAFAQTILYTKEPLHFHRNFYTENKDKLTFSWWVELANQSWGLDRSAFPVGRHCRGSDSAVDGGFTRGFTRARRFFSGTPDDNPHRIHVCYIW